MVKVGSSSLTTAAGGIDEQRVDALVDVLGALATDGREVVLVSSGAIADALADRSDRNSARQVGTIMARHGGAVPWHRVVASSGRLVPGHEQEARQRLLSDGVPFKGDHVDMSRASWRP